jgi:arsenite transporter
LACSALEFGTGSQINLPIAVFIGLMIIPMMMKVDFTAIQAVGKKPKGVPVTPFVNWMVKPFSMALISWLFFRYVFSQWIFPAEASQYIAGTIILAAAPGTAMVFVCSYLTDEDPAYPPVQIPLNDLIRLFLFALIVRLHGAASLSVPFRVLFLSVVAFMAIPLAVGATLRALLLRRPRKILIRKRFVPKLFSCHDSRAAGSAGPHLRVPGEEPHLPSRFFCRSPLIRLWPMD